MSYGGYSSGGGSGGGGYGGYGSGGGSGASNQSAMYAAWAAQAAAYSTGVAGGGYSGSSGGGYGGAGGGGYGGASSGGYGGGSSGASQGAGGGGGNLQSKLQAMASMGGAGGGFGGGRGGRGALGGGTSGGYGGGSSGGGYDMKKFAAYQTNKRKFDDRGGRGGGRFGGSDAKRGREDRPKREKQKPREGREPELNIFIDRKFNYWNLPVKARVILVSNIPQAVCQPDLLYNIFSFYGDVERIKIIKRANSCALVEFTTATFACIARDHLDNASLRGEKLVCTFSRFDRVRMPHEAGLPQDGNTKDFSGREYDKFKRYRNEDLKKNNMKKIIVPSSTIHISGIQSGKSPNDVKRLFESIGLHVSDCIGVAIKAKKPKENEAPAPPGTTPSGPKMFCYVQFNSVDDGLIALANFGNSVGMRMSFAKDNLDTLKKNCIEKKLPLIMGDQKA